jgi:Tol biopolymer transport system component
VTRLTTHPHVDTFPRIAPDGTRVVFCRSQREWVSQRDPVPWDVYVLDLETGRERRVARSGNTPTWSADGRSVFFQRDGEQCVRHDIETGEERVLFAAGRDPLPRGVKLQTPVFSAAHDALAVTLRGPRRATVVLYRDGRALHVGGGCQLVWTGITPPLCYVDHGGRQKNVIYAYDPATQTRTAWIDLPGAFSHEYFPSVSNDGSVLVFGASRGGRHDHEHDTADYEIFAWPIGAPAEAAVRLTHHTGNDCWPDIRLE